MLVVAQGPARSERRHPCTHTKGLEQQWLGGKHGSVLLAVISAHWLAPGNAGKTSRVFFPGLWVCGRLLFPETMSLFMKDRKPLIGHKLIQAKSCVHAGGAERLG